MELQVFSNAEFGSVRSIMVNNEPYFVGKDVAEILGYKDTAKAIFAHVDAEDKGVGELPTPGGVQNVTIINESGLSASFSLAFLFNWYFPLSSKLICGCEIPDLLDSSHMLSPFSSLALVSRCAAAPVRLSSFFRTDCSTLSAPVK